MLSALWIEDDGIAVALPRAREGGCGSFHQFAPQLRCAPFGMPLDRDEEDRLHVINGNCSAMVLKGSDAAYHPLSEIQVRSGDVLNVHF
jgi:hypothetical protein